MGCHLRSIPSVSSAAIQCQNRATTGPSDAPRASSAEPRTSRTDVGRNAGVNTKNTRIDAAKRRARRVGQAHCKTVAQATLVRIQYPPPPAKTPVDPHEREDRLGVSVRVLVRSSPAVSGLLRLPTDGWRTEPSRSWAADLGGATRLEGALRSSAVVPAGEAQDRIASCGRQAARS